MCQKPRHLRHLVFEVLVEDLGVEVEGTSLECDATDCSRGKTSLWDSSFDISAHNKLCYLLKKFNEDCLCSDAESLLG